MNRLSIILCAFVLLLFAQSCKQKAVKEKAAESQTVKPVLFAADESFQPIADAVKDVFNEVYSKIPANIIYKSENEVLKLLYSDSVRLALLSRDLTVQEVRVLKQKNLTPEAYRFAVDAVSLIVSKTTSDTLITVQEIKKMLSGDTKTSKIIVFDNANSSLARYLTELSGLSKLGGKNVFALKNNKEVLKYVSTHPDAIGVVGFSWLDDPDDDYKEAVSEVKVMAVKDLNSKVKPNEYFKPSQNTLALKQYPLTRGLYVINCTGKQDLGTNFAYFLLNENGQRIILRSGILPNQIPARDINIKHTL